MEKLQQAKLSNQDFDTIGNETPGPFYSNLTLNGKKWYKLSDIIAAGEKIKRYSPGKSKLKVA